MKKTEAGRKRRTAFSPLPSSSIGFTENPSLLHSLAGWKSAVCGHVLHESHPEDHLQK
jgi:hypothetical protein